MKKLFLIIGALFAFSPMPALAQYTAQRPATCSPTVAGDCIKATTIVNPDGTFIGGASATIANGVTPAVTATASSSQVIKASPGNLYGVGIVTGATAGYLMLFNAITAPADGTVSPVKCMPVAATTGFDLNYRSMPVAFSVGITAVFSSGANCFTKTASATAFISGDAK